MDIPEFKAYFKTAVDPATLGYQVERARDTDLGWVDGVFLAHPQCPYRESIDFSSSSVLKAEHTMLPSSSYIRDQGKTVQAWALGNERTKKTIQEPRKKPPPTVEQVQAYIEQHEEKQSKKREERDKKKALAAGNVDVVDKDIADAQSDSDNLDGEADENEEETIEGGRRMAAVPEASCMFRRFPSQRARLLVLSFDFRGPSKVVTRPPVTPQ